MIKSNIYITPQLRSRLSLQAMYDIDRKLRAVLPLFPELNAERIEVGLTRAPFCYAIAKTNMEDRIKIVLNPRYPLTYFTLGHELTHFVQHIDEEETGTDIPYGEVQCDVWTIARDELFLDLPPFYLRLPKEIECNWSLYADQVRALCIAAIDVRKNGTRRYLKWLEHELFEITYRKEDTNLSIL